MAAKALACVSAAQGCTKSTRRRLVGKCWGRALQSLPEKSIRARAMADHSPSKLTPETKLRDVLQSPAPVHSAQPCSWYGWPRSRGTLVQQPQALLEPRCGFVMSDMSWRVVPSKDHSLACVETLVSLE